MTRRNSSAPRLDPVAPPSEKTPVSSMTAEEKHAESKRRFQAEREHLKRSPAHRKLLLELAKR